MPPKPKYTKDEIITAAFELVRERGSDAMTAREVGKCLGVSSSPIFTSFRDMEELRVNVVARARARFDEYIAVADGFKPAFKKRGMQWVKFAQEEPMLFRLLFMCDNASNTDLDTAIGIIPTGRVEDVDIIMRDYAFTREQAEHLFRQMWVYTYGLCSMCAAHVCRFEDEEISNLLTDVFTGLVHVLKAPPAATGLPVEV